MQRPFLIDTDTASDDAVALIMALRHPHIRVTAITVVSGNVPLRQAVVNALYTVELCGAHVPVYAGADRPLLREPAHAHWYHGRDGLGDMNYPPPTQQQETDPAVEAILRAARENPGIELVTLGPLANIAHAIRRDPRFVRHVSRCVVMGGNPCCEGNVTPAAEYNFWCDPDAARIVLRSGLPIELVGWHLCRGDANLSESEIARIRAVGTPLAHFIIDCNRVAMAANLRQSGDVGIALPDPVAMALALDPSICIEHGMHHVEVETDSELTRGMTVIDRLGVADDERNRGIWSAALAGPRHKVCWRIDVPRWKRMLFEAVGVKTDTRG